MDMTPEFILLALTLILALVQIGAAAMARTAELGVKWNAGPRDAESPPPFSFARFRLRGRRALHQRGNDRT